MKNNSHFPDKCTDAINLNNHENYFQPIVEEVFNLIDNPNEILDVGCGNGLFTLSVKDVFSCKATGVDSSDYALSQASKLGIDNLVKVSDLSSDQLPFNNEQFDFVVCKDVLEHLVDPEHCINEIYRVTKKSGYVLIHVPNHFPIVGRLKFLFTNNMDTFDYFPDSKRHNFPHLRFFTKKDLISICGEFSLVKQFSYFFFRLPFFHRLLSKNTKKKISEKYTDNFCEGYTFLFKKDT